MKGLKTGEYIKKINLPKANVKCAFCTECLIETTVHLFSDCETLATYRRLIIELINKINLYQAINIQRAELILLFCTGVIQTPVNTNYDERKLFKIFASFNKAIWDSRNAIRFNSSTVSVELKQLDAKINKYVGAPCRFKISLPKANDNHEHLTGGAFITVFHQHPI